ncbi:MAG: hypothetical protein ACK5LN_05695 [Propioniciclava sp.]
MNPVQPPAPVPRKRRAERYELQATYRYLRLGIVLLGVLLFTGVILQIVADGGAVLPSVSAYYYTPARGIFVGSLSAIGACMIIYRGRSDTEDGLLNMAGYLAFFVAFVPTPRRAAIGTEATATFPVDLTAAVVNNSGAILIVGLLGFTVQVVATARSTVLPWFRNPTLLWSLGAYVGFVIFFFADGPTYVALGHYVAALGMFLGMVGVVGVNGIAVARARRLAGDAPRDQWASLYTFGFALMLATVGLGLGVLRPLSREWLFLVEAALIAQFLAYWITQTVERWRVPELPQDQLMPG